MQSILEQVSSRVTSWSLTSCLPHWATSGQITHSNFFYIKKKSLNHKFNVCVIHCFNVKTPPSIQLSMHVALIEPNWWIGRKTPITYHECTINSTCSGTYLCSAHTRKLYTSYEQLKRIMNRGLRRRKTATREGYKHDRAGITLRASLSGTFLQTLPDLVTPLKNTLYLREAVQRRGQRPPKGVEAA